MNILSLIQNQLSPQTVDHISNTLGESPEGTRSALGTAFPALLGSLLGKANSSPSGIADIFSMFKQGPTSDQSGWSDALSNPTNALSSATSQSASRSLLGSLLGPKLGPVSDLIANRSGIRGSSASSLLTLAAPLLMGTVGKLISSQNLGAAGLGQLLNSQTPHLKESLPPELASTLGIGNLLSGPQPPATYTDAIATEPAHRQPARAGSPILKWGLAAAVIALAALFITNRTNQEEQKGGTSETSDNTAVTGRTYHAPDFSNLNLTPGSVGDRLAKAISSGQWNKPVGLQGLSFDNSGDLTDSSKSSLQEAARVLSTVPNAKIEITASGESEEVGLKAAMSIKSVLTSSGVSEDRILTRGETGTGAPTISLMR